MTYFTTPDGLPAPDDYQRPADSPSAFRSLADATQGALSSIRAFAQDRITQNWGNNLDVAISQATLTTWRQEIESRVISAGTGLIGGGSLAGSRTLTVDEARIATRSYVDARVDPKSDAGHTHPFPFRFGRPGQSFPIGANQSTGNISIAHGLGRTPGGAIVSVDDDGGDASVFASIESWDGTYLYAQMRNIGDAEAHVYINWIAW
jgi:hypothetical protein